MTRAVTEILRSGWMGDLTTLSDLQLLCGLSNEEAAKACFVSLETYRRWLRDRTPNPMAIRLLTVIAGYFPWDGWQDWEMHSGYLFPPGYSRYGLKSGDILSLPFLYQLVAEYQKQRGELSISVRNTKKPTIEELKIQPITPSIKVNY